jgi:hypothetical protein
LRKCSFNRASSALRSGPERARLYLGDEADELLRGHYSVINVWRPIVGPVLDTPLGVCNAQSMAETDLLPTEQGVKHEVYMINSARDIVGTTFPR